MFLAYTASRRLDEGGSSQLSHGWRIGCGCVRFRILKQKHLAPLMLGTPTFETNRVCLCISQAKREQPDIAFACSIHSAYGACSSNGVAVYIYARICLFVCKLPQTIRHRCAWLMQTRICRWRIVARVLVVLPP